MADSPIQKLLAGRSRDELIDERNHTQSLIDKAEAEEDGLSAKDIPDFKKEVAELDRAILRIDNKSVAIYGAQAGSKEKTLQDEIKFVGFADKEKTQLVVETGTEGGRELWVKRGRGDHAGYGLFLGRGVRSAPFEFVTSTNVPEVLTESLSDPRSLLTESRQHTGMLLNEADAKGWDSSGKVARVGIQKVNLPGDSPEWRCRLYVDGKTYEPADYFTNDKEDAENTKISMLKRWNEHFGKADSAALLTESLDNPPKHTVEVEDDPEYKTALKLVNDIKAEIAHVEQRRDSNEKNDIIASLKNDLAHAQFEADAILEELYRGEFGTLLTESQTAAPKTGPGSVHDRKGAENEKQRFKVWQLLLNGNEDDGWEVNDRRSMGVIEMPAMAESLSDQEVIGLLIEDGFLRGKVSDFVTDPTSDDDYIKINSASQDEKPLIEMELLAPGDSGR